MNVSKAVAVLLWLLVLANTLLPPRVPPHLTVPPLPKLILLFPIVFFALGGLLARYPFEGGRLRVWIDRRWGDGTYIRFIQDLKPMLLMGVSAVTGAAACAFRAHRAGAPPEAYSLCSFTLSCGLGFLLARAALAWRGLLLESPKP